MNNMEIKINSDDIANPDEIPLLSHLECTIDFKISLNPVLCSKCETIFCQSCIDDWRKKSNSCPMRCTPLEVYSPGDSIIRQQLKKIKLFCINKKLGCDEHILVADMKYHEKNCLYQPIKCEFCSKDKIPKLFYTKHLMEECQHNVVKCISCDEFYFPNKLTDHLKKCVVERINCEFCNGFHTNVTEKDKCIYSLMKCPKCKFPDLFVDLIKEKHICLEEGERTNNNQIALYVLNIRKKIIDFNENLSLANSDKFDNLYNKFTTILSSANEKGQELFQGTSTPTGKMKKQKEEQLKKELDNYKQNIEKIYILEDEVSSIKTQVEGKILIYYILTYLTKFIYIYLYLDLKRVKNNLLLQNEFKKEHEVLLSEINKNVNNEELGILIQLLGENCVRNLDQHIQIDNNKNIILLHHKSSDESYDNNLKNINKSNNFQSSEIQNNISLSRPIQVVKPVVTSKLYL